MLLAFAGSLTAMAAATLTNIPMQGTMVMPKLSYQAALSKVTVEMTTVIPQLTPLLVSHPGDRFDPADPWFGTLDPGAGGLAFSRRYGFVMSANTDLLPTMMQIWIRKLSGSPELLAYRHQATEPKAFLPIFGTGGTTNAMYWNGLMFHPTFASMPGTNSLSATFEAYLLDVASGQEIPGSSSGPFILEWTNLPDGRPGLHLDTQFTLRWPATTSAAWKLEAALDVNGPWQAVTNDAVAQDGWMKLPWDRKDPRTLFRMRLEP